MTQFTENVFAVEVPEGVEGCEIRGEHPGRPYQLLSFYGEADAIDLPLGNWQLLCTTREATEEIAASIVQIISNGKISGMPQYRRYDRDPVKDTPAKCWTRDSRHSLETLLASKGLDGSKNYVLLKKQKP